MEHVSIQPKLADHRANGDIKVAEIETLVLCGQRGREHFHILEETCKKQGDMSWHETQVFIYPLGESFIEILEAGPKSERRNRGTSLQTSADAIDLPTSKYLHLTITHTRDVGCVHQRYTQSPRPLSINSKFWKAALAGLNDTVQNIVRLGGKAIGNHVIDDSYRKRIDLVFLEVTLSVGCDSVRPIQDRKSSLLLSYSASRRRQHPGLIFRLPRNRRYCREGIFSLIDGNGGHCGCGSIGEVGNWLKKILVHL